MADEQAARSLDLFDAVFEEGDVGRARVLAFFSRSARQ